MSDISLCHDTAIRLSLTEIRRQECFSIIKLTLQYWDTNVFFLLLILRQLKVFNDIKDMKLVCQSIKFARKTIASGKSSSIALLLKTFLSIKP